MAALISEHRSREVERLQEELNAKDATLSRLRSAFKLLWGVQQQVATKAAALHELAQEGSGLLESLDSLLQEEAITRSE